MCINWDYVVLYTFEMEVLCKKEERAGIEVVDRPSTNRRMSIGSYI